MPLPTHQLVEDVARNSTTIFWVLSAKAGETPKTRGQCLYYGMAFSELLDQIAGLRPSRGLGLSPFCEKLVTLPNSPPNAEGHSVAYRACAP